MRGTQGDRGCACGGLNVEHRTSNVERGASGDRWQGSAAIAHLGSYGALSGKAVALEPATGFSFDTPLTPIPH